MNVRFQDTSVFGVTILMLGLAASAISCNQKEVAWYLEQQWECR